MAIGSVCAIQSDSAKGAHGTAGLPTWSPTCEYRLMKLRDFFARAFAMRQLVSTRKVSIAGRNRARLDAKNRDNTKNRDLTGVEE
jgi:hypothetical protein